MDHRIPEYIHKICKQDPFSGKAITGGIVAVRDSKWLMSWTVNRQPRFKQQPTDQIMVWMRHHCICATGRRCTYRELAPCGASSLTPMPYRSECRRSGGWRCYELRVLVSHQCS